MDNREEEIFAITQKSLDTFFMGLRETVTDQIAMFRGPDFKDFIENHLPITIRRQCKQWVDGHGDALRSLIMRLSSELTGGLNREFHANIPLLEPSFVSEGIAVENMPLHAPQTANGRLHAGVFLGGLSVLLAITGLGIVTSLVGLAAYPSLASHLEKKGLEEAKLKLKPELDRVFNQTEQSMRATMLHYLSSETRGLQQAAEVKYRQMLDAAREAIDEEQQARNQPVAVTKSRIAILEEALHGFAHLEEQLHSITVDQVEGVTQ